MSEPIYDEFKQSLPYYKRQKKVINDVFSIAFYGSGLMYHNVDLMTENNTFDSYDINSAYVAALLNEDFPLSSDVQCCKYKEPIDIENFKPYNSLYIVGISIKGLKSKYLNEDSCLYKRGSHNTGLHYNTKTHCFEGWLCNIDIEIIKLLYKYEYMKINVYIGFKKIGKLNIKSVIDKHYTILNSMKRGTPERTEYKQRMNKSFYGKSAFGIQYDTSNKLENQVVREPVCLVSMFQVAYVRRKMADLLIKYYSNVVYIDTDCIRLKHGTEFNEPISSAIGDFKLEWCNKKVYFLSYKAYIIYNNDGTFDQKISRIGENITQEQIETLKRGETVETTAKYKGETIKWNIRDIFHRNKEIILWK